MSKLSISRSIWTCILFAVSFCILSAQSEVLDLPAPQYMLPMYDHFSQNPGNTTAMGRGETSVADIENIGNAVNNPATLMFDKGYAYLETCIKAPIAEINEGTENTYTSPVPFGLIGVSAKLHKSIYSGLTYSMPKSILLDDFHIVMNQGAYWYFRYPSYNLHQFTHTINFNLDNFNLGLNTHLQMHRFQDLIVLRTFERLDFDFYNLRLQPGILYMQGGLTTGLTFTLPTNVKMDIKYADYDVNMPAQVSAGVAYRRNNKGYFFDADWEQFSKMDSRFEDRLTLGAGYESRVGNTTYRAGCTIMPGVFEGTYWFPVNTSAQSDTSSVWASVPTTGSISETDQFFITGGFTYHFKGGELSFALMQDLGGKVNTTRVMTSLGFETSTFKNKKFLIFDK